MCVRKNVYQLQIKWGIGKNGVYLAAFTQCRPYYTLKYIHHWIFRFAIFQWEIVVCCCFSFFFVLCPKRFLHTIHTQITHAIAENFLCCCRLVAPCVCGEVYAFLRTADCRINTNDITVGRFGLSIYHSRLVLFSTPYFPCASRWDVELRFFGICKTPIFRLHMHTSVVVVLLSAGCCDCGAIINNVYIVSRETSVCGFFAKSIFSF